MHKTTSFLALLAASALFAATDAAAGNDADEQAILALEKNWAHAYLSEDAACLETLMHPAFVLTNARGVVSAKPDEVAEVREHAIHYDRFESSDLKTRVYGDAAVVTGLTQIRGTIQKSGRVIEAAVRFTDTFIRQDGKWQVVASQTTVLPAPGKS